MTREEVFADLAGAEHYYLRVLEKLEGFAIAADQITAERGQGAYHLIVLNSSDRTVTIRPYAVARLEEAAIDYADMEERTRNGEPVEAVLVSAGPIDALRKAYPNYFLDTQVFVGQIRKVIATVPPAAVRRASRIAEERAATEPQQTEMLLTAS
jgi:hypothetical protein